VTVYPKVNGTSPIKRSRRTKAEIAALDEALVEIVADFRPATVRQVFYQAVNRAIVPKSETTGYRVVQRRLVALREAGEIPYGWIVDGTRYVTGHTRYRNLAEFTDYAAGLYRKDYWDSADVNVEVWLEKEALKGVLIPTVVSECGLGLHVTRGFASITYLQEAAEEIERDGRPTHVYVLTDFDPSGVSIAEKVESELQARAPDSEIHVRRLAVNRDQIDAWNLPTRPTKTSDTRAKKFRRVHGTESVELDAIPPDELRNLVRAAIDRHMDSWQLEQFRMVEREERQTLREMFGGAA
jgi:5S rRNA maturation endonuclease (ribonuclease M5)